MTPKNLYRTFLLFLGNFVGEGALECFGPLVRRLLLTCFLRKCTVVVLIMGDCMKVEIEPGVPIPQTRCKYPFDDMLPGDSIFFKDERKAASARVAAVRFAGKYHPTWGFTLRRVEGGWRLWRAL